jgi:hypothetical protein
VIALSSNVARPSICQAGRKRLGKASGTRPKMARTIRAQLSDRSRWTMCVNSWVKTSCSQSPVFPMYSEPAGHAAVTTTVS